MPSPDKHRVTRAAGDPLDILEPGQMTDQRTPIPRAQLSRRAEAVLWVLRITVLVLVFMVGYTFVTQLWP
jgi:hypothetical protein